MEGLEEASSFERVLSVYLERDGAVLPRPLKCGRYNVGFAALPANKIVTWHSTAEDYVYYM